MFDLEQEIKSWRRRLVEGGLTWKEIEELERHLRDHFAASKPSENPESAWKQALSGIGEPEMFSRKFDKLHRTGMRRPMIKTAVWLLILTGIHVLVSYYMLRSAGGDSQVVNPAIC